jgi:class I fructose-bisphosphate aldolase
MEPKINSILTKGKAFYLAYDQGLEHGPNEFNDENVDPLEIINIAKRGKFNGIIFQKGIANKYKKEIKKSKVPLILKLNGRTNLYDGEPMSMELCTVKEAVKLGAKAVGYTIYIGSQYEPLMMEQFEQIEREAHALGLPVIAWIYPRGKSIQHKSPEELMAYATRVALEIGADIVKIKFSGKLKDLKWAVKAAGKCKVVVAGGEKTSEKEFLKELKEIKSSGAAGVAIGRNIWKSSNPLDIARKARKIIMN